MKWQFHPILFVVVISCFRFCSFWNFLATFQTLSNLGNFRLIILKQRQKIKKSISLLPIFHYLSLPRPISDLVPVGGLEQPHSDIIFYSLNLHFLTWQNKFQVQLSSNVGHQERFNQGSLTEGEGSVQLTSFYCLVKTTCFLYWKYYYLFTNQATLMRRSTVLSLPIQLVFPGFNVRIISAMQLGGGGVNLFKKL